jgi:histone-lysine N-methyltransferase SETMAR
MRQPIQHDLSSQCASPFNMIHHNNALPHSTLSGALFLISKCMTVMPQPPYSPVLTPCESFLFQKVKSAVKEHHFEFTEDIQRKETQVLNDIPQGVFQESYKQWQHCWKRCVQAQGMYFEVDHIVVDE